MSSSVSPQVIVVGVDDSDASRAALAWAADEAVLRGAVLELVTTWGLDHSDLGPNHSGPQEGTSQEQHAAELQQRAAESVLADRANQPEIRHSIVHASPTDALIAASRTASMIVVGTHGRGPVRTFLFGSVAQALLKQSHCPVLVIPPAGSSGAVAEDAPTA